MRYGKIAIYTLVILFLSVLAVMWSFPREAKAATVNNSRFGFPVARGLIIADSDQAITVDNIYVIFVDRRTGYMAHKTTGVTAVNTSWANAAVEGASQATTDTGSSGTNTNYFVCDPPPLEITTEWDILIYENSTPANTDVPIVAMKYDPVMNEMHGGENLVFRGAVPVNTTKTTKW